MIPYIIPGVSLVWLDELSRSIIVRNVEPETVGDSCRRAFPEAKRVPANKVGSIPVRVVQGVEEVWGGGGEEVFYVLLQSIYVLTCGVLCNLYINIVKEKQAIIIS